MHAQEFFNLSTMGNPIITIKSFSLANCKKIAFAILLLFLINYSFCQTNNTAIKGVQNLQHRNWAKDGLADLNGQWEFYWNTLYTPSFFDSGAVKSLVYATVPGFWNNLIPNNSLLKPAFGYATYRLKVLCPPSNEKLAIKFLTVASAYKLFVNGRQIAEIGKVGTNRETTTPAFQPLIVPVTPINNELDILIQVANFTYNTGGLWDFIKLGTGEQVNNYQIKSIALDFFVAGSFFLIGIFYLVVYYFFSRRKSPLYFALFCILIGIRPLVTDELGINYITQWSWQFIRHVEFTSLYLTVPVMALFSFELFPKEFSRKALRYILLISIPFVAATLFTSPFIFRYTLRPFQLFILLTSCYGAYVYINAVKDKRHGSVYFLIGFIILVITAMNDILYSDLIIQSTNLLYVGLYILVICQATTLSKQFFKAYAKIKKLNEKLRKTNNELNVKSATINEANEQLSKLNAELDTLVFRTSHDLRSPITSIITMTEVIKMEEDPETRNEYLNFLKKTILRLDNLITEILQYAKNKSTALQYEELDLNEFVSNVLQDHIFSYDSDGIKRIVEVSQSGVFETDKSRLGMIINNLISNGLKHHNKKQAHPYLKITVCANEKQADIMVSDNGQGIAQNHLDNIFNKFYRGNTKSDGSGFGLYIVKETVEKLEGSINVKSEVNIGTSFHVVIPNHASRKL
jgi:signal transduction histidine kinase